LLEREDRTASVVEVASRRLQAITNHRQDLEQLPGITSFQKQAEYLGAVRDLASRGALSRFMYLCEPRPIVLQGA
jgi:hypothetical protein